MTNDKKVFLNSLVCLGKDDPDFRSVLSPMEARRMGRLLKRAIWTSKEALRQAGIETPGAIITATDFGCVTNSVDFLTTHLCARSISCSPHTTQLALS